MKLLKLKKILKRRLGKYELPELFEKGQNFVKSITDSDNVIVLHHSDVDGYCSAAIFVSALEKLGLNDIETIDLTVDDMERLSKTNKIRKFSKIIILDIAFSNAQKELKKLPADILIIDHHMLKRRMNSKKIIYINPRYSNEERYQPVSYVSYKLLSEIVDLKDKEWMAVLGTIGDYAFDDCKDLITKWTKAKKKDDITNTIFWKASKVLYNSILSTKMEESHLKSKAIIKILNESENLEGMLSNYKLKTANRRFETVYEKTKKEFWKNAESVDDVIISTIRPLIARIGSPIATNVSTDNKDKIIFLLEKRGNRFKVHARCQTGIVHMGKLMKKCCNGGGHRNAAGGSVKIGEVKEFKDCVLDQVKKAKG